jgi:ribosomal-protein-alanine N-acetyltransferase
VTLLQPQNELGVHVRWMIRRDMPEVVAIEREAFEFAWSDEDFTRCLRQRNCIGMVGEIADSVVSFMIYELQRTRLHVLNFAVLRSHRRLGVGSHMLRKLLGKLTPEHRNRVLLEVRETNLPAQLFFRDHGFRAVSVLKDFYQDTTEDAYLMEYLLDAAPAALPRGLGGCGPGRRRPRGAAAAARHRGPLRAGRAP